MSNAIRFLDMENPELSDQAQSHLDMYGLKVAGMS